MRLGFGLGSWWVRVSAAESVAECCACCVQPLMWDRRPARSGKARSGECGSRSSKRQTWLGLV